MRTFTWFIGIDISKSSLDFALFQAGNLVFHRKSSNNQHGISLFVKKLHCIEGFSLSKAIFCMENTGIYNHHILHFLDELKANICLQSALQIKYSTGLQRGKNDKIDSKRIAQYAYQHREHLKLWQPQRPILQQLKHLVTLRNRLIKTQHQLKISLQETARFTDKTTTKQLSGLCKSSLQALGKDLKKTTQAIQQLIRSDEQLNHLFHLVTSVEGIGPITATEIILTTNEFKDITDGKKYAAYAGVVPFEHSSGSSIRGKTRVSKMANQSVKTLLHMATLSVISRGGQLKDYYQRKVAQGKNKMSVINAIRNKLVLRIFACIRQNRPYQAAYLATP